MELDELKKFLKVDGSGLDVVLPAYQLAAEVYLLNAGVTKDYANPLYKVVITVIAGTFLENPALVAAARLTTDSLSITLNALIAQLRLSQVTV
jgi:uncharacterized phage protein (predicted DNA packaging)